VYQRSGDKAAYTRQKGFSDIQNEQMVLNFVGQHGLIRRAEAMDLCRLSDDQAFRLLKRLVDRGQLRAHGEKRGAYYTLPDGG
jgi:ATP-dependent DNA helicase RecG